MSGAGAPELVIQSGYVLVHDVQASGDAESNIRGDSAMHNQRPETGHATFLPDTRRLRAYLEQLVDYLDDSSLRATLNLMICEARGAIHKQRALIASEQRGGRDTVARTEELRELEAVQAELLALCARHSEDDLVSHDPQGRHQRALAQEPVRHLSVVLAT